MKRLRVVGLAVVLLAGFYGCSSFHVPYPESTENLNLFSSYFDGVNSGIKNEVDGNIYYFQETNDDSVVVPLEVESLPFGWRSLPDIGYDDPRYYRIKDNEDWVYEYWKSTRTGYSIDVHCRAEVVLPLPEQATQLFLSWGYPLPGEKIDALFVSDDASLVLAITQAIASEGEPQELLGLHDVGSIQLRSPLYHGVALNYRLQQNKNGNYFIIKFAQRTVEHAGLAFNMPEYRACPLGEEVDQAIHHALQDK